MFFRTKNVYNIYNQYFILIKTTNDLRVIFSQIEDPRSDINKLHKLEDILLIGVIVLICAADTWKNMETNLTDTIP